MSIIKVNLSDKVIKTLKREAAIADTTCTEILHYAVINEAFLRDLRRRGAKILIEYQNQDLARIIFGDGAK